MASSLPSRAMRPLVTWPNSPKRVVTSSVRPEPISPAIPRISPLRSSKLTPLSTSLLGLLGSVACRSSTLRKTSPGLRFPLGKRSFISRPTIRLTSLSTPRARRRRPGPPRELLGGLGGDEPAVAQHRDGVGDPEELLELVRDVDAGDAVGLQHPQDVHELVDLGLGEGGGRLVEDQDPGILRERLGDLGHLHLPDAQPLDDVERRDGQQVLLQHRARVRVELVPVDGGPAAWLLAQEDVLAHRQLGDQRQLLVDDGDPLLDRLRGWSSRPA